jgi:anionic cell wall polymer biosynthesis LytR-Cps2A-Psr (LCP) family protein
MARTAAPTRPLRRVLPAAGLALFLVPAVVAAGLFALSERLGDTVVRIPGVFASTYGVTRPAAADGRAFLLIGTDSRNSAQPGAASCDQIMIADIDATADHVAVVSIPVRSVVAIPGRGPDAITAACSADDPGLLVSTVEQLTARRVDHVAVVDFARFDAVVDALGGVDIATAGHLDGAATLQHLRAAPSRAEPARARRQEDVLRAVLGKAISSGTLTDPVALVELLDATSRSVALDDTLTNGGLRSLALDLHGLRPADVTVLTAPTGEADGDRAGELWESLRRGTTAEYAHRHPEDLWGAAPA